MIKDEYGLLHFGPEEEAAIQKEIERHKIPIQGNIFDYYEPENQVKGTLYNWQAVIDNKQLDCHFHLTGKFVPENSTESYPNYYTSRVIKIEDGFVYTKNSIYRLDFPLIQI